MTDHDDELDEIVVMLTDAGLVSVETIGSKETYVLTAEGAQVATQMAMSHEDDGAALLDALLEGRPSGP